MIRKCWQEEYNKLVLNNPQTPVRTFNVFEDPELKVLYDTLNKEMEISAGLGLTLGLKKRERTELQNGHLNQILSL